MNKGLITILAIVAVALIVISQSLFIVDQREQAIVLQLGNPIGDTGDANSFIKDPGLHVKIPLIQSVQFFDRRILSVDPESEQVVISSSLIQRDLESTENSAEQVAEDILGQDVDANDVDPLSEGPTIERVSGEPILVDTFARYKIVDPLRFLKTLRTIDNANMRLETILNDATRAVLGQTTLKELLSDERTSVMNEIKRRVNRRTTRDELGIDIVDIRIVRADLTSQLIESTVRRMISELKERATETRAKGEERALEIRSTADKERTVILANAQRDSEIIRGQGDNEAIKTYADAFNKDKEFYSFIRSMEAYRNTLANPETRLILSPDSDFFQYFKNSKAR